MAADGTLFVDLSGMEMVSRGLGRVAEHLAGQDTLTYGLPLGRMRVEERLSALLAERRQRLAQQDELLADLAADLRAAREAYIGVDEAAASAASPATGRAG